MDHQLNVHQQVIKHTLELCIPNDVLPITAAVKAIYTYMPDKSTVNVQGLDYKRFMEFLFEFDEGPTACTRLPDTSHEFRNDVGKTHHYRESFVWHAVTYAGEDFEVFIYPRSYGSGALAVGDNVPAMKQFADAANAFCSRPKGRILVYSEGVFQASTDMDKEVEKVSWDDVYLPADDKDQIMESVTTFFHRRDLYEEMGVSWKRGVLLVGPPGTGKTQTCKAILNAVPDKPAIYLRDLDSYGGSLNRAIKEVFTRARDIAPGFLVLEDIDGLIHNENRAVRTTFLNEMDGMQSNEGILTIATSNHPHEVDEALLKRPSRFDRVFWVVLPASEERYDYASMFAERAKLFDILGDPERFLSTVTRKSNGFTLAYLKEAFISSLLHYANHNRTPDDEFPELMYETINKLKATMKERKTEERASINYSDRQTTGFGVPVGGHVHEGEWRAD